MLRKLKKLWLVGLLLGASFAVNAQERNKLDGWCQQGGQQVVTQGLTSTTRVQRSYPGCTVTVFNPGTMVLATIFADSAGTPLANPFTANGTTGYWFFYGNAGSKFDIQLSGASIPTYTRGDIWVAGTQSTGSGTTNFIPKWTSSTVLGNSIMQDVGGVIDVGGSMTLNTNNLRLSVANEAGTGTIVNRLVSLTGAPSTAIRTPLGATSGVVGIAVAGAGTTGSVSIAYAGRALCVFDGATQAGAYVVPSSITAGMCNGSVTVTPAPPATIGTVLTTNIGAGTYEVLLFGPDRGGFAFTGSNGEILWNNAGTVDGIANSVVTVLGEVTLAATFRTSGGTVRYFKVQTPADLALGADAESIGIQFGGNASAATVTRQFTAGGGIFPTQREYLFVAPTYAATSAETMPDSCTLCITGAPIAGPNMTITRPYAFWVQAGDTRLDGDITGDGSQSTRLKLTDAIGFPATTFRFNPAGVLAQTGNITLGQVSFIGTRDMLIRGTPDTTSGYTIFEGVNALGSIFGNNGNNNPILFYINSVHKAEINSAGTIRFRAGDGSTSYKRAGGSYNVKTTSTTTSTTAETDLFAKTLEANVLGTIGDYLVVEGFGLTSGAGPTDRTLRYYWGATGVAPIVAGTHTFNNTSYTFRVVYIRTAATDIQAIGYVINDNPVLSQTGIARAALGGQNFATTNVVKITGQTTNAANTITLIAGYMNKFDNP